MTALFSRTARLHHRDVEDALATATSTLQRLWLNEPADQSASLELHEEMFDIEVVVQRMSLRQQMYPLSRAERDRLANCLEKLENLEQRWNTIGEIVPTSEPTPAAESATIMSPRSEGMLIS